MPGSRGATISTPVASLSCSWLSPVTSGQHNRQTENRHDIHGVGMKDTRLTAAERDRAYAPTRKPDVTARQNLDVRYHIEDFDVAERPRRFLEAFAAILKHSNYRFALDHFIRLSAKCARCSTHCQVYE